jgi:hypothetical protein
MYYENKEQWVNKQQGTTFLFGFKNEIYTPLSPSFPESAPTVKQLLQTYDLPTAATNTIVA